MNTEVEQVDVLAQDDAEEQAAYDAARGVAQEVEQKEEVVEQQAEETVATETPQTEPEAAKDELTELRSQVEKMGDVFKRLDDVNGRYGRLSQRVEEMQQKIVAAPHTAEGVADAKELMKEMQDDFPELAAPLERVFAKVLATKGGIDHGGIDKLVSDRLAAERDAARVANDEQSFKQIIEFHPDFAETVNLPKFAEWKETLSPRLRARLETSTDPFFVADQVDAFKEWNKEQPQAQDQTTQQTKPANQANKKRLADAVMPKGTNAPLSATQISEQEAYDKARAEARRIKK